MFGAGLEKPQHFAQAFFYLLNYTHLESSTLHRDQPGKIHGPHCPLVATHTEKTKRNSFLAGLEQSLKTCLV